MPKFVLRENISNRDLDVLLVSQKSQNIYSNYRCGKCFIN